MKEFIHFKAFACAADLNVLFTTNTDSNFQNGKITFINLKGAYVSTPSPLLPKESLNFSIELDKKNTKIEGIAEVKNVYDYGFYMEFLDIEDRNYKVIERFIESCSHKAA